MCKTKFLQMCSFSITMNSLHSLNLPFLLLSYFISTAIPKFPPWFSTSPCWFSAFFSFLPRFQTKILENSYSSSKTNTLLCYYCISLGTKSLFTSSETSSVISPKKITLKCLKFIICEVWANNYDWMKCYSRFMSKRSTTCLKL